MHSYAVLQKDTVGKKYSIVHYALTYAEAVAWARDVLSKGTSGSYEIVAFLCTVKVKPLPTEVEVQVHDPSRT